MFVNINCEPASVKETLCSLRFAAKVNQCETGAKGGARKHITELPSDPGTRTGAAEVQAVAEYTVWMLVFAHVRCASHMRKDRLSLYLHYRATIVCALPSHSVTACLTE